MKETLFKPGQKVRVKNSSFGLSRYAKYYTGVLVVDDEQKVHRTDRSDDEGFANATYEDFELALPDIYSED